MGSLGDCLAVLQSLAADEGTNWNFPNKSEHSRTQDILRGCPHPSHLKKWMLKVEHWASKRSSEQASEQTSEQERNAHFEEFCQRMGKSLLIATQRAYVLRHWAEGNAGLGPYTPRVVLYRALIHLVDAFRGFDIVARHPERFPPGPIMDYVRDYLRKVYDLSVILGSLADPNGCKSVFSSVPLSAVYYV